jgi:hypothetical protein
MNAARAGVLYGGLAFAAGAVLGPLRELVLAPRIGGLPAALVEAAAMALLLWRAADRVTRGNEAPRQRAAVAMLGLIVVLLLEALLALAFDASGLAAARAPRGLAEQGIGVALLAWLFALPFLVRRRAVALP